MPEATLDAEDLDALQDLPGVTPDELVAARARLSAAAPAEAHFGVWDENWATFMFFCRSAWHVLPLVESTPLPTGGTIVATRVQRMGLNMADVQARATLQRWPRAQWAQLLADLDLMQDAVLAVDAPTPQGEPA